MYLNEFKLIRRIKWIIYYILRYWVRFEYLVYSKFFKSSKTKRLFLTTGNISLINVLAIINEIGSLENYEDILVIDTGKGKIDFMQKQLEIANLHSFKKIIVQPRINPGVQLVLNNYYKVDELYLLNHPLVIKTVLPLFPNIKVSLIDEGAASLLNYDCHKIENLESFISHCYINKLDFCSNDNTSKIKFKPLDILEFRKIANKLSEKYPLKIKSSKEDKMILYCGIYWEVTGLSRERFIEVQSNMLNELIEAGYKILYKPHPRDNEYFGFDTNPNVQFIDCKYPIELYNLDILALVSISSTAVINYAHYWEIPCFSNIIEESLVDDGTLTQINIIRKIIKEYSPDYKSLLQFDVNNISKELLKTQIKECYQRFIVSKPLLSENKKINVSKE